MFRFVKNQVTVAVILVVAVSSSATANDRPIDVRAEIDRLLTEFHLAASRADGDLYFQQFASNAVFLGTSPEERWELEDFVAFAKPFFDSGQGWTYVAIRRNIEVAASGDLAWFDEVLDNEKYGACRGSGVLVRLDGAWKIAQYNLALLIPNEVTERVVEVVRQSIPKKQLE